MQTQMPVVFIGHGNPMNAIRNTSFTRMLNRLGQELPKPKTILCISAHWMTEGTYVTHMAHPKTIHDFYGFPQELLDVQYPAPGDLKMAEAICRESTHPKIHPDNEMWGIDHGTWSVLTHMYPAADIPLLQLSIPTVDHWYPLLYILGASDESDALRFEYEGIENASISMRCLSFGRL